MSNSTPNLNLFKYDVSTDSNVAFSITKALNNNWDIIDEHMVEKADKVTIEEQLAGKVDTNASNLSTQGKSLISRLGMPSSRYIDLTLGANGSTYTAPANGWFSVHCKNTSNLTDWAVILQLKKYKMGVSSSRYYPANSALASIPCKKGDIMTVYYDGTLNISSPYWFTFIYAEGSKEV